MRLVNSVPRAMVMAVFLGGFMLAWNAPANAQPNPILLDHYKIYRANTPILEGAVRLNDQFGPSSVEFRGPFLFGLPVDKNSEGIRNFKDHLTWYEFFDPQPTRQVVVENQFGEAGLIVRDGIFMLVPALKNPEAGEPAHHEINHFKCYKAQGNPVNRDAVLVTQFGTEQVNVAVPELLCNPAEKVLPDGTTFPIIDPNSHLVCYRIEPLLPLGVGINYVDQFVFSTAELLENQWLCVPSLKTGVTDSENSTWGRVKSIYR